MDCHVFRRICQELTQILPGTKLEKIHEPVLEAHAGISLFSLYGQSKRNYLFLKFGREPFIFLSEHKVAVDKAPAARTMRLRKYLSNARINQVIPDWLNRTLTLSFHLPAPIYLRLSLRTGPELLFEAPPLALEPIWTTATQALENPKEYPWLTPPLRKTLPFLDSLDQDALIQDLALGSGDLFVYLPPAELKAQLKPQILAWPLPSQLQAISDSTKYAEQIFEQAIPACQLPGQHLILDYLADSVHIETRKSEQRKRQRLEALLQKLATEKSRLTQMTQLKASALLLQANLYQLDSQAKLPSLTLDTTTITLDPKLTIAANMAKFFHTAARGQRGLNMLSDRYAQVQAQLQDASLVSQKQQVLPPKAKTQTLPKNIELIVSIDNFNLLRGRDAKGNASLLKLGANHDFWLHVEGGPGCHVIIRRNHPSHEVPEATLLQAAKLAKEKSWAKDAKQAEVTLALLKHIKPLKTSTGAVKIEKVQEMVIVKD